MGIFHGFCEKIFFVLDTPLTDKQRKTFFWIFICLIEIDHGICERNLLSKEETLILCVHVISEVSYHLKQNLFFKETCILSSDGFL